jgi:hypothetical protein
MLSIVSLQDKYIYVTEKIVQYLYWCNKQYRKVNMCIRREMAWQSLAFSPVSKPHTHITYMLRQCTSIVYIFSSNPLRTNAVAVFALLFFHLLVRIQYYVSRAFNILQFQYAFTESFIQFIEHTKRLSFNYFFIPKITYEVVEVQCNM